MALILLYHSDRESQSIAFLHSVLLTLGIFFVTFILVCEIHLISIVLITLLKSRRQTREVDEQTLGKAGLRRSVSVAALAGVLGAVCWVIDRLGCRHVRSLGFNPQLHMWWHIFCAVALQHALVLSIALYRWRNLDWKKADDLPLPLLRVNNLGLAEVNE